MADLAGETGGAAVQLVFDNNARTDPHTDRDINQIRRILPCTELLFTDSPSIRFVINNDRQSELSLQLALHPYIFPAQIRGK
ncbi:hypothetical protein D3C71_2131210 [compost metagenome]